jgi:hypothetical protein
MSKPSSDHKVSLTEVLLFIAVFATLSVLVDVVREVWRYHHNFGLASRRCREVFRISQLYSPDTESGVKEHWPNTQYVLNLATSQDVDLHTPCDPQAKSYPGFVHIDYAPPAFPDETQTNSLARLPILDQPVVIDYSCNADERLVFSTIATKRLIGLRASGQSFDITKAGETTSYNFWKNR